MLLRFFLLCLMMRSVWLVLCEETCGLSGLKRGVLRVMLTRGEGSLGISIRSCKEPIFNHRASCLRGGGVCGSFGYCHGAFAAQQC